MRVRTAVLLARRQSPAKRASATAAGESARVSTAESVIAEIIADAGAGPIGIDIETAPHPEYANPVPLRLTVRGRPHFRSWSDKGRNRCPDALVRQKGLAERHYKVMSIDDIKALQVGDLALPDCALFLWTVSCHLDQAIEVGELAP